MSGRVLMLSWLFPPQASIGSMRADRLARHLPAHGWSPTVLCRREVPAGQRDPRASLPPAAVAVDRSYDHPAFAWLVRRGSSGAESSPAPSAGGLRRPLVARAVEALHRAVDAVVPMETVIVHAPHAASRVEALAPGHDVVWSTSYPYHSHLLALRAARRHRLPFVADLRDPWTPNWVHRRKLAPTRWVEARCERAVVEAAAAVVVTTEALAARYREMFPAHAGKFRAIHNCYDPVALAPRAPREAGAPLRVVHFGNVYGPWSLATLFAAVARLRAAGELPGGVELLNLGKLSDRDRAQARALGLEGVLRVAPPMPYDEGLALLRRADLLALAAWDDPDARLYIQGKLYDYLLAGVDLVAETSNPEVADIVGRTGAGAAVAPGDVAAMADCVRRARDGVAVGARPRDEESVRYFSAPRAAGRLAALLDEVRR